MMFSLKRISLFSQLPLIHSVRQEPAGYFSGAVGLGASLAVEKNDNKHKAKSPEP